MSKKIIIIAGPNGAGKTLFARSFLPEEAVFDNVGEAPFLLEWGENQRP